LLGLQAGAWEYSHTTMKNVDPARYPRLTEGIQLFWMEQTGSPSPDFSLVDPQLRVYQCMNHVMAACSNTKVGSIICWGPFRTAIGHRDGSLLKIVGCD